jgi:agmatine deiminase
MSTLVTVYPLLLGNDHSLITLYQKLHKKYFASLPTDTGKIIITKFPEAVQFLKDKFWDLITDVVAIPECDNIWIRDWAPINASKANGSELFVKAQYKPNYAKSAKYRKNATISSIKLAEYLNIKYKEIPLVLDGGNFAHNGNGIGIITNRVISDNENYSVNEIIRILKDSFELEKLLLIPVEPYDITGHTDGVLRFVDENILILGDYPDGYPKGKAYLESVYNQLKKELQENTKIIRLINDVPLSSGKSFPSAQGNYINYLEIGDFIFLPNYYSGLDKINSDILKQNLKNKIVINVDIPEIIGLSSEGGVLNCISWVK